MIGGIVEIADTGRHLSIHRGFLKVTEDRQELGRVPLDDITALILSGPQITLSKQVITELSERKSVIVTCGRNWHPLSFNLPFVAHFEAAGILHDQIEASEPLKKRLWQTVVRAKINNQATVLRWHAPDHGKLKDLSALGKAVKSGDPDNREAVAARHYWQALMGDGFRRDRFAEDGNVYLNYGYTVLRAATARAVCAAGLHPALGIHHKSRVNAFALIDDLMEPFRPLVDSIACYMIGEGGAGELTPDSKRRLVAVLQQDLISEAGISPLINTLGRMAQSLVASLAEGENRLVLPELRKPGQLV